MNWRDYEATQQAVGGIGQALLERRMNMQQQEQLAKKNELEQQMRDIQQQNADTNESYRRDSVKERGEASKDRTQQRRDAATATDTTNKEKILQRAEEIKMRSRQQDAKLAQLAAQYQQTRDAKDLAVLETNQRLAAKESDEMFRFLVKQYGDNPEQLKATIKAGLEKQDDEGNANNNEAYQKYGATYAVANAWANDLVPVPKNPDKQWADPAAVATLKAAYRLKASGDIDGATKLMNSIQDHNRPVVNPFDTITKTGPTGDKTTFHVPNAGARGLGPGAVPPAAAPVPVVKPTPTAPSIPAPSPDNGDPDNQGPVPGLPVPPQATAPFAPQPNATPQVFETEDDARASGAKAGDVVQIKVNGVPRKARLR